MKKFSKILIVIGVILMFSAAGNDDMTASHYPLYKLLLLLGMGVVCICNGILINRLHND